MKRSSENHTGFGTWIVDSGASHHVCGDRIAFDSLKRLPKPTTVYLGDGSRVFATGSGEVRIDLSNSSITIQAFYVPDLTYNLLSVDCLLTNSEVSFQNGSCYIKREHSTQDQLASLQDGIYHVKMGEESNRASRLATALAVSVPSFTLWHQHLAHLSKKSLSPFIPQDANEKDAEFLESVCQVCIKAKHSRKFE